MRNVTVVGSGASGVHFALTLLQKGYHVSLIDVGYERPSEPHPETPFEELKSTLNDPAGYFLGDSFESVIYPDDSSEFYGFPPSKTYVFEAPEGFGIESEGFQALFSFAQGGLAQAWTAGVYPFNDEELADFPFGYAEIGPHYAEVARRIGISGEADDLARFFPVHDHLMEPLALDRHSQSLMQAYQRNRARLNEALRCYMGRTRVATLSSELDGRKPCSYLGRCLWGCPTESLYTPRVTLRACRSYPNFTYIPGSYVERFGYDEQRRITHLVVRRTRPDETAEIPVETLALAAGTLSTAGIYLRSIHETTGEIQQLGGLMDNRQVLVPFVNLGMVGRTAGPRNYQYHQVGMGLASDDPRHYVHGQVTTLKSASFHPVIQQLPVDFRTAISVFRKIHAALGVINLNLHDTRRLENAVSIAPDPESGGARLVIRYRAPSDEAARIDDALARTRKALLRLGCIAPKSMTHIRPMGASVHYTGTLPMSTKRAPMTTSVDCKSHDFENLYVVDGSTFPFLPAKNLTFTLMANAVRVASKAF